MYREIQLVRPEGKQALGVSVIQQAKLGWKLYGNPFDLSGLAVQPMVRDDDPAPTDVGEYRIIEKSGMATVPAQIKLLHEAGWLFYGVPFSMNGLGAIAMVLGNVPQYVGELQGASCAFNGLREELDALTALVEAGGGGTTLTAAEIKQLYESNVNTNAFTDQALADLNALKNTTGFSGKFADLTEVPAILYETRRAAANGVASLDASGKVPLTQLNISGLVFKGAWNAATNVPDLVDGTGSVGDFYKVSVAGTFNFGNGNYTFAVGDWVMFAGGVWQRLGVHESVTMVNGKIGDVVLNAADVGALPASYTPPVVNVPVQSVNGKTGALSLNATDVGALPDTYTPPALPQRIWRSVAAAQRTFGTWRTNTSQNEMILYLRSAYTSTANRYFSVQVRKSAAEPAALTFNGDEVSSSGFSVRRHITVFIPAGWQYQVMGSGSTSAATTEVWQEMS